MDMEQLAVDLRVRTVLGTVRRVVSDAERRPVRVERNRERVDAKNVGVVPFRLVYNMYICILKLIISLIDSQCNLRRHGVA